MSDVKIVSNGSGSFTFNLASGALEIDEGLESAVLVSLFSDQRVPQQDAVDGKQQGWWADIFSEGEDPIGSKLWTLRREKITNETITKFEVFTREALAWLVEDEVASEVEVDVESRDHSIFLEIRISRPLGDSRFNFLWNELGVVNV